LGRPAFQSKYGRLLQPVPTASNALVLVDGSGSRLRTHSCHRNESLPFSLAIRSFRWNTTGSPGAADYGSERGGAKARRFRARSRCAWRHPKPRERPLRRCQNQRPGSIHPRTHPRSLAACCPFICGNHRGNCKRLKQLELLSRQSDIRRVTGASSVNLRSPAVGLLKPG
jgi:hypothetical protein